jgi:hypothetical protein
MFVGATSIELSIVETVSFTMDLRPRLPENCLPSNDGRQLYSSMRRGTSNDSGDTLVSDSIVGRLTFLTETLL